MDPKVQALITQGYPPDVVKKMVESGMYDKMTNPLPGLPNLTGGIGSGTSTGTGGGAGEQVPPELQPYIDQGYNIQEAEQLHASENYSMNQETTPVDMAKKLTQTTGMSTPTDKQQDPSALFNSITSLGAGVSLDEAAYTLGQSIGAEKGTPGKTLGMIGSIGKLTFGLGRNIASGLGQAKKNQYIQDYYDDMEAEALRDNYTPAPQAGNVNYLGGNSYGEDGGIKGKTLPLKDFLKGGGFKKPGFKKLM